MLVAVLRACGVFASAIVLFIFGFVITESWPALRHVGARFLTDPSWHPASDASTGKFNLIPIVIGTLAVTFGAVIVAVPLGISSALFCQFYAPRAIATLYRRLIELLAGIPSVVYGFWGLVVLVPLLLRTIDMTRGWLIAGAAHGLPTDILIEHWQSPGTSLLIAIAVLAIMITPMMALVSDSAIRNLPTVVLHSASALGLSRWTTIRGIVLPGIRTSLGTGLLLTLGRALGETMAVLLVCGNVARMPPTLFGPVRTLTTTIAAEMAYASGDHRSALFVSGLALLLMVAMLVSIAETMRRSPRHV